MPRGIWLGLFLATFISNYAHAFNSDRCGNLFPKTGGTHYPWFSPLYVSTMGPSTTSYFSSFGPCAMYGSSDTLRTVFVDESLAPLKVDASRGKGQYLNALAELSGCPTDQYGKFSSTMQAHYEKVFPDKADSKSILAQVDQVLKSEPDLKKSCRSVASR